LLTGPTLYWLPPLPGTTGRLAISARPRGGDWLADEVAGWNKDNINVVTSMLTSDEELDLNLSCEADECKAQGIDFISMPIVDRSTPSDETAFAETASELATRLIAGENIAIHCRQGIGRSAMLAAAILMTLGMNTDETIRMVSVARGLRTPETEAQTDWLRRFQPLSSLTTGLS